MMKQLILALLTLLSATVMMAHQSMCGPDTIRLELNGFQYGNIQWEESYDSVNWDIIQWAIDTVYEVYVDKSKFFRAQLTSPYCPPEYSDVFTVSIPIQAKAGMDRATPTNQVLLHGNEPVGTNGRWTILSGANGILSNADTASSTLTGTTGNTYVLEWELTSPCGTTRDTVKIRFVQNVYSNNIIYIDSTDQVLSDSVEIANGTLRVIFSDSTVSPDDSSSILFLTIDGYNLRAYDVAVYGDTFEISVVQGTISDILKQGVIDFSPFEFESATLMRPNQNRLPTRQKILDGHFKNGQILYSKIESPGVFEYRGMRRQSSGEFALSLTVSDTIYKSQFLNLILTGGVTFVPNIVAELEYSWLGGLDSMIFGLDNATLTTSLEAKAILAASVNLVDIEKSFLLYRKDILFLAGSVPIWVTTDVYLKTVFTVTASGQIEATCTITAERSFDAYIYYDKSSESFKSFKNAGPPKRTITTQLDGIASLSQELKAGPGFSISLYRILTGYVDLYALKENFEACMNLEANWKANLDLSTEVELGGYGKIIDWEFFNTSTNFNFGWYSEQFPKYVSIHQGNLQVGDSGKTLPSPITVQVRSNQGVPVPWVKVYFEALDGVVSDSVAVTDGEGIARVYWTQNGDSAQYLRATIRDCDKTTLGDTTTFTSYSKPGCDQSSLSLYMDIDEQQGLISPSGIGGSPPYEYSRDGATYSNQVPTDILFVGKSYTYFIIDQDQCLNAQSYTYEGSPPPIANFTANARHIFEGESVAFNDLSENNPTSWVWNFGDGSGSPFQNTSHTYSTEGTYTVKLAAYNNFGGDTTIRYNYIKVWKDSMIQKGFDIDGQYSDDQAGYFVSLSSDGNTVAIGSPYNDDMGRNSGHVRIFDWYGVDWQQRGNNIPGEDSLDNSGWSVSMSSNGNTVAIGAPLNDGNGLNSGQVRIYDWNGSQWQQRGSDIDGKAGSDHLGWSVALSSDGNTAVIGSPHDANGHVGIYDWLGGSQWQQRGNDIFGEFGSDEFGYSVSISSDGNTIAVGALYNNGSQGINSIDAGHVRIYDWSGSQWQQRGTDIDGEAAFDQSGYSVSISADGNVVAIGAGNNDGGGSNSGHVRVYEWDGLQWWQRGGDIDGEASNDFFGRAVSLSADGDRVAIGARGNDGNGNSSGHVRIYEWTGGQWKQRAMDIDGESAGDFSGWSVALSSKGNTVAIGARANDGNGTSSGQVRVYIQLYDVNFSYP